MREYRLSNRKPESLYRYFEDICAIPRISYHEASVAAYVISVAKEHGLWYYEDEIHNVLVRKPASKGCEEFPFVLLEGHLDIVGEKAADSTHDFETDPIELIPDGDILYANNTTLGADNGCAVAMMLKILTDKTLVHPPIECLFTVQEEVGLLGAKHFDASKILSRRVIGLDAGSEGVFRKGTSTKYEITAHFPAHREPVSGKTYRLFINGLKGGDQGAGIPLERICAIKMTARVLHYLNKKMDVRLISINRTGKSIPESCVSYICLVDGNENDLAEILKMQQEQIRLEYAESDSGICISAMLEPVSENMLVKADSDMLIRALYLMPYGSRYRSLSRIDEVSCSVVTKRIHSLPDSIGIFSVVSTEYKVNGESLSEELKTFVTAFGFQIESEVVNQGLEGEAFSPIRDVLVHTYESLFGTSPKVNISHGGNDCVVLKQKIPDLDVITTAPTYVDFHTPKEHLYMDTFEKVAMLIEKALENLTTLHQ